VWAILAKDYWHDPVPEPDERGYDPAKHSPEALAAQFVALGGEPAAKEQGAGAEGAGEGGVMEVATGEEGEGLPDGLEDDSYVEDMPDVPAVDMM
jgi:hypothetical protein